MANKKVWTRNYDNAFSALYGIWGNGPATQSTPDESAPFFRICNGGSWDKCYSAQHFKALFSLATTICPPSVYMKQPYTTIDIITTTYSSISGINAKWGICIGSGEADPTYEDWDLQTPIRDNVSVGTISSIPQVYDQVSHTYTYGFKVPLAYSGSTTVNVNEFGLYAPFINQTGSYNTSIYAQAMLVYHEVFESPIVLEQNDTIEITITQTVQQPNYTPYPSNPE